MCTLCSARTAPANDFAERMMDMLNHAAVVQMTSVGHRTGLFDTMSGLGPATIREIADAGGLNERYVREWLGAMTTGLVVDHDPEAGTFWLPDEHARALTRSSPESMASVTQFLPELGSVETEIVSCFREGGGVPYDSFPRFHEIMAEESGQIVVSHLFDAILPLAGDLEERLDRGIDVLDIGCGRGLAVIELARRFPRSRFVGYDLSTDAIAYAAAVARESGLANVRFEARDLTGFAEASSYDLITAFDAIHDQKDPASVLAGVAASLRPGGLLLMQDMGGSSDIAGNMDVPLSPFMYTVSCMHCMTVSLAQGGVGVGAKWGEQLTTSMLRDAGFTGIETHKLEHDVLNVYYLARAA